MSVSLRQLPVEQFEQWRRSARERMVSRARTSRLRVGADAAQHVDRTLARVFVDGYPADGSEVLAISDGDETIGSLWLWLSGSRAVILDTDLPERLSDDDLRTIRSLIRQRATAGGAQSLGIEASAHDAETWQLVECGDSETSSIQMLLDPVPQRAMAEAPRFISLTPMKPARFAQYVRVSTEAFAASLLGAGLYSPEEAIAESRRQFDVNLPHGVETAGQHLYAVKSAGSEVGILWFAMRNRAGQGHAFIYDIEVSAEHRGQGYGTAMMLAAEQEAQRLGAISLGLHVFADNAPAIRMYEGLGYQRVQEYLLLT